MADEPENMVLLLLRELRSDMKAGLESVERRLGGVDGRLERLEKKVENIRQAQFADSLLGRYAVAEVEERLEDLTRRLEALESRR